MKCKNCGAELTMLEKFCPNCGTPNEQSQQHIKDMEYYEHEFSDTQKEVVRNSKWFIKYIAPVTSLVIAGIAAVIVTIQANHLWGYNLAEQKQKKYNQTHEQEIKEHLQTLLDNGQYEEVYQLYTRLNQRMSGTGNSGWYDFYNMTEGYLRLRNAIMFYYNPELSEHYSKETALNNAAEAICMITGSAQGKSYRERAAESIPYMEDIKEKANIVGGGFDSLSNYYTTYLKNEGVTFDSKLDPTSDKSEKAVDYYLDGVEDGYFRIAGTDKYLSAPFGNETIAMFVGSNASETFVKQGVNNKFEIGVAPYPAKEVMQQGTDLFVFNSATAEQKTAAYEFLKFLTTKDNQITWATQTGYIPVRESAINSDEYKNTGSLIAPIIADATKNLFTNPLVKGMDSAYRESNTVLESILAEKNPDVKSKLEAFKSTLMSIWE